MLPLAGKSEVSAHPILLLLVPCSFKVPQHCPFVSSIHNGISISIFIPIPIHSHSRHSLAHSLLLLLFSGSRLHIPTLVPNRNAVGDESLKIPRDLWSWLTSVSLRFC